MTEVPKIVYDRLRAALPSPAVTEGSHPDPDVLTAFAEQALSVAERDRVLEHLARCGDCRELIAVALPAADMVAAPVAVGDEADRTTVSRVGAPAPRKLRFTWPSLRWAALAAGIVVAATVLLVRPGKLNQGVLPSANQQVATTAQPIPSPQIESPPPASRAMDQSAIPAKTDAARPKSEFRLSKKLQAGQVATPSPQAESGILLAESKIADNKQDLREADKLSAPSSAGARALDYNAPAIPRSSEAVEVTAESPVVPAKVPAEGQTEVSSEDRLTTRNDAPQIVKAKPAATGIMSMAKLAAPPSPARARNVTWMIAAGVLQRSLDSGQSWQATLHADHPLLCYASHDQDVWTGGQAGTLFHSADSGVTWLQLQPSINNQPLTTDITHIDVHGPAEVVISTSNHEIWSSADNGKTWEKK